MGVEFTLPAAVVTPPASDSWSTTVASATVDRPEYSSATIPRSALVEGVAVMVGRTPPMSTGAVHTLISAPSEATKCVTSTKGSLVESVTDVVVAPADFHAPTSTTRRFPAVTSELGTTEILVWLEVCALAS